MIQAIMSYQFVLEPGDGGILEPDFKPVKLIFNNKDFSPNDYSDLLTRIDIFGIFYQHTTGMSKESGAFSNFYVGRLRDCDHFKLNDYKDAVKSDYVEETWKKGERLDGRGIFI